jgi:hypothetical protein
METKTNAVSWADVVAERQRREDEPIARRYAPYKEYGRGHLHPEVCRWVRPDW